MYFINRPMHVIFVILMSNISLMRNWLTIKRYFSMSFKLSILHFLKTLLFHYFISLFNKIRNIIFFARKCVFVCSFILYLHINNMCLLLSGFHWLVGAPVLVCLTIRRWPNKAWIIELNTHILILIVLSDLYFEGLILCLGGRYKISWHIIRDFQL